MASKSKTSAAMATALAAATAQAVRMLQDPETRAQLLIAGNDLAARMRQWNDDRRSSGVYSPSDLPAEHATSGYNSALPAVGQERLERRVEKLSATLDMLRPETGASGTAFLDKVYQALNQIRLSLAVAKNLPLVKRKKAHREISKKLSDLETAVMDAALGNSPA
ncbi:MAG: hypothetical protein F2694_00455 [Actinobacteria bacterium]|nr:hypothetical protein [Actinomycetota bacterium]MTA64241.1 hypothetical protein [Actinomycetota bacterium]